MRQRLVYKLLAYFGVVLVLSSFVVGAVFIKLYTQNTLERHKAEMIQIAGEIALSANAYLIGNDTGNQAKSGHGQSSRGMQGGLGMYLNVLDRVTAADIWIVDNNSKLITRGSGKAEIQYSELPEEAEEIITLALSGETSFGESFNQFLEAPSITLGMPIYDESKAVVGAVLLHESIEEVSSSMNQGFRILLLSVMAALGIAGLTAVGLSFHFTKPLKEMKQTALALAEGNYLVKTDSLRKDEFGDLAHTLDLLADRLSKAEEESLNLEKLRRNFISNISHELRTPVTVLRGSLEALTDEVITDPVEVKAYYQQMLKESIYLQRLINDLLELSRLQSTDFSIEYTQINVVDVIKDVVRSMTPLASAKTIELLFSTQREQYWLMGDYDRLRQMILVIVDNSLKFSPEQETVILSFAVNQTLAQLIVEDHGPGIPAEDLESIFDRFNRGSRQPLKEGTGLGLSIARQIALRHNIRLEITSDVGVRTQTIFTFPPEKEEGSGF